MSDQPTSPLPPPPGAPTPTTASSSLPAGRDSFLKRFLPWIVAGIAVLVAIGAAAAPKPADLTATLAQTRKNLTAATSDKASVQADLDSANGRVQSLENQLSAIQADLSATQTELEQVKASKIKTVTVTKTVTKTVPKWVPNGNGIEVDLSGFEGEIEIHDVQITHSYGYTSVIGIAVNKTGTKVSYVELGCSLLSSSGKLLANTYTNQTDWPANASWGFDCTEQADASGAVLRVNSLG